MMQAYFITGTDTDCGKTYVTARLTASLNQLGKKTQALKPLASGCITQGTELISTDVLQLQAVNANPQLEINAWRFAEPIAPHLAANHHGQRFSAAAIAEF